MTSAFPRCLAAAFSLALVACATDDGKWKQSYTQPANDFRSGYQLIQDCTTDAAASQSFCEGYLAGATDMLGAIRELGGYKDCLPDNTKIDEIRLVVLQSTRGPARPPFRLTEAKPHEHSAVVDVIAALNEKWGCGVPYYAFNPDRYTVVPRKR